MPRAVAPRRQCAVGAAVDDGRRSRSPSPTVAVAAAVAEFELCGRADLGAPRPTSGWTRRRPTTADCVRTCRFRRSIAARQQSDRRRPTACLGAPYPHDAVHVMAAGTRSGQRQAATRARRNRLAISRTTPGWVPSGSVDHVGAGVPQSVLKEAVRQQVRRHDDPPSAARRWRRPRRPRVVRPVAAKASSTRAPIIADSNAAVVRRSRCAAGSEVPAAARMTESLCRQPDSTSRSASTRTLRARAQRVA